MVFQPGAAQVAILTAFDHPGAYAVGQMRLYDVGFASMVAMEAEALAQLAPLVGRGDDVVTRLTQRAATQRALIASHLWDEEGGIFTNRFWNGSFYRRISPTSFYAMLAKAPTDAQAAAMVTNWLLSPEHFCVAPNGDFAGNHDDCCAPLPAPVDPSHPATPNVCLAVAQTGGCRRSSVRTSPSRRWATGAATCGARWRSSRSGLCRSTTTCRRCAAGARRCASR